ncbi:MAG TPA: hypothetical protein VGM16_06805 [Gammaproteobacteria bacterium]
MAAAEQVEATALMTETDENEQQRLLTQVAGTFMRGYGPWGHRIFLVIFGFGSGSAGFFFGFYPLLKQDHPAPFPLWFLAIEWGISCASMLLLAEGMWRVGRYIARSERDSWIYLIRNGINPYTLTRLKKKDSGNKS